MTLYRLADNLAIRVGRNGIWIWAPDVSEQPFHLDARTLTDMGLHLGARDAAASTSGLKDPLLPPTDPIRNG